MSAGVTAEAFERSRAALLELLRDVHVAEGDCPKGARVAVVGYGAHTRHLIRFHDYRSKKQLLALARDVSPERNRSRRRLGAAVRFVGAHVLKRARRGRTARKAAVFFSHGPSQDGEDLVAAVMEYRALNIAVAVVALGGGGGEETRRAFQVKGPPPPCKRTVLWFHPTWVAY